MSRGKKRKRTGYEPFFFSFSLFSPPLFSFLPVSLQSKRYNLLLARAHRKLQTGRGQRNSNLVLFSSQLNSLLAWFLRKNCLEKKKPFQHNAQVWEVNRNGNFVLPAQVILAVIDKNLRDVTASLLPVTQDCRFTWDALCVCVVFPEVFCFCVYSGFVPSFVFWNSSLP